MKNKRFVKLFVTSAAAILSLAACGGETSSVPVVVNGLDVTRLESAVVGDKINLKDYVTVDGNTEDFTAEVANSDYATLDGYELTVLKEGDITVYITAGDAEAVFEFEALSVLRDQYRQVTENVKKNYTAYSLGYDNQTNQGYIDGAFMHNEDYYACSSELLYDDDKFYGMMVAGDGNSYNFELSVENNREDLNVLPGKIIDYHNEDMYTTSANFSITYDKFMTTDLKTLGLSSSSTPCLYGESDVAAEFMNNVLGLISIDDIYENMVAQGQTKYNGYSGALAIVLENVSDTAVPSYIPAVYVLGVDKNEIVQDLWFQIILDVEEGAGNIDSVDEYIASGKAPEAISGDDLVTKINEFVDAKNYSMDMFYGWTDKNGIEVATPASLEDSWMASYFVEDKAQVKVTNTVYDCTYKDGMHFALVENDGKVYQVKNYDTSGNVTTDKKSATSLTSLWGSNGYTGLLSNVTADLSANAAMNIFSQTVQGDKTVFEMDAVGGGDDFLFQIMNIFPGYGSQLVAEFYDQMLTINVSIAELLLSAEISYTADTLVFDLFFRWDSTNYYHMKSTFTDFGTTEVSIDLDNIPNA